MSVSKSWTNPETALGSGGLDVATGDTLPETYFDALASNLDLLGGATGRSVTGRREWAKGSDIASSGTIAIPTDGNIFDVTGTTGITTITAITSGLIILQFDGALKVTHGTGAGNPKLKDGQDFYTQAGAHLVLYSDGTNFWEIERRFSATAAHGRVSANLGGDVTMTTAGTEYDGPSVSLVAGVWKVTGQISMTGSTSAGTTGRAQLWDGTNVFSSSSHGFYAASQQSPLPVGATIVLTATTTVKISAKNSGNAAIIRAAEPYGGVGNFGSGIHAVRLY